MPLLQISSGAVRAVIWVIFSHLTKSDVLGEVDIVIIIVPSQIDQSVQVAMTHDAVPKGYFFRWGTRFDRRISMNMIYWVSDVVEFAGRGQIRVWQCKIQTGFSGWSFKGRLPWILYRLLI